MLSARSDDTLPGALKVLIAGGFAVGKTTLVGAVSEIEPLTTEAPITEASLGVDDLRATAGKTTTTVAMDFGRISVGSEYVLYLFGTPGQQRFWFMWDDLCTGALGAVVLADTQRLEDCFEAVDFFENRRIPFLVAVNRFDGTVAYPAEEVRSALELRPHVPVVECDARDRESSVNVLIKLVQYLLDTDVDIDAAVAELTTDAEAGSGRPVAVRTVEGPTP